MRSTETGGSGSAVPFAWPVAASGYRWSSEHELCELYRQSDFGGPVEGPWLIDPTPSGAQFEARIERPLSHQPLRRRRDLHVEFANLPLGDDEQALSALAAFASRYGMLGVRTALVTQREAAAKRDGLDCHLYSAEHLRSWQEAIAELRGLTELIKAAKEGDAEQLRRIIRWTGEPLAVQLTYTWPQRQRSSTVTIAAKEPPIAAAQLARWARLRNAERYVAPLEHYLYARVNERLAERVDPKLIPEQGVVLVPDSLLGALYWMLAEQLTGAWPMKSCRYCGRLFVPRSRCDQATCSDACRKALSRAKKRSHGGQP